MEIKKKTAIVILAHSDFESLEISLYVHSKFLNKDNTIYILQNGRGTYDCERTYRVAKRYENLYPKNIKVIDNIEPNYPYYSIKKLLNSNIMQQYDYICKMDDDTFPIDSNWLDNLCDCYEDSYKKYGDQLAYITGIVNNNSWGFVQILEKMELKDEYFSKYSREHYVGNEDYKYGDEMGKVLVDKNTITYGVDAGIWRIPYISRWVHKKTTLNYKDYLAHFNTKEYIEVDNKRRYSINCILFKKEFWNDICNEKDKYNYDDEHLCFLYSFYNNKKIIASCNVPLIHIFFNTQREENKDLIPLIRDYYEKEFNLPYPISICKNKEIENENRIRFNQNNNNNYIKLNIIDLIFSIHENDRRKMFIIFGIRITLKK